VEFAAFFFSMVSAALIVRFQNQLLKFTGDINQDTPQKFHTHSVTRVGGVPVFVGLVAAWIGLLITTSAYAATFGYLILSVLPAFFFGLREDLTKRGSVLERLIATMVCGAMGYWLLDATLTRLAIPVVDNWLQFGVVSFLLTIIAVGGVGHALNIIDGFNGLAGMFSVLVFGALSIVAFEVGDGFIFTTCITMAAASLGFLFWNYPHGRIFLGDGGAYLLGVMIALLSVLLVARNPSVSPWFPLLLVIYPVWETLFSIYRKKHLRGMSPGSPDGLHLHMIIYKRLVRWAPGAGNPASMLRRNSMTSPYLWILSLFSIVPALLFWKSTTTLQIFAGLFVLLYLYLYWSIVRFKTPSFLIIRSGREMSDIEIGNEA
jgi:UDP-GlcNAc:undecaprenyl-phosphate GlcNAc-1-phosphate transferase